MFISKKVKRIAVLLCAVLFLSGCVTGMGVSFQLSSHEVTQDKEPNIQKQP